MTATRNHKKRVTAAMAGAIAATAAPALIFLGAGTAQAYVHVSTTATAMGVTVHVQDMGDKFDESSRGWCTYTAIPATVPPGVPPPLPVYNVPFYLEEGGTKDLWFPGIPTGTDWKATVSCGDYKLITQVTY